MRAVHVYVLTSLQDADTVCVALFGQTWYLYATQSHMVIICCGFLTPNAPNDGFGESL